MKSLYIEDTQGQLGSDGKCQGNFGVQDWYVKGLVGLETWRIKVPISVFMTFFLNLIVSNILKMIYTHKNIITVNFKRDTNKLNIYTNI